MCLVNISSRISNPVNRSFTLISETISLNSRVTKLAVGILATSALLLGSSILAPSIIVLSPLQIAGITSASLLITAIFNWIKREKIEDQIEDEPEEEPTDSIPPAVWDENDDRLIERMLDCIEQDLRNPPWDERQLTNALDRILGWDFDQGLEHRPSQLLKQHFKSNVEGSCPLWDKLKSRLAKYHLNSKQITTPNWVTGSKSAALIGIAEVATTTLSPGRAALVPTGVLLDHQIVPLTGELREGIQGVNRTMLSGAIIDEATTAVNYAKMQFSNTSNGEEYQKSLKFIMNYDGENSLIFLKLHLLRYLKLRPNNSDLSKVTKKLNELLKSEAAISEDWKKIAGANLLGTRFPSEKSKHGKILPGSVVGVPRSDGSRTWGLVTAELTNPDSSDIYFRCVLDYNDSTKFVKSVDLLLPTEVALPQNLLDVLSSPEAKIIDACDKRKQILEMLNLVQKIKPYSLDKTTKDLVVNPYPIVWGAQIPKRYLNPVYSDCRGEKGFRGTLPLGIEGGITSAFCTKKDRPALNRWLKKQKVNLNVQSLKALHYLALKQITHREEGGSM